MSFEKILIANRGEIACRVIATAQSLGYRTVAVYSEPDAGARHVQLADEAVCVGPALASASYLNVDALLDACRKTGADAVHPGYGFLSENAGFSRACKDAGITFIGPDEDAIHLMGSKRLSKLAMIEAGVPCIPGYEGEDQSDATLLKEAERIGLPLALVCLGKGDEGHVAVRLGVAQDADVPDVLDERPSEGHEVIHADVRWHCNTAQARAALLR